MTGLQFFDQTLFRYQQDWFVQNEWWRVLTAHWVHVSWTHMTLNALGLALCISITRPGWKAGYWCLILLLLATFITAMFTILNAELGWYVGFSGVLFGLYAMAAIMLVKTDRVIGLLLFVIIAGKVGLEQMTELNVGTSVLIGSPVIVDAHLYGFIGGLLFALMSHAHTILRLKK